MPYELPVIQGRPKLSPHPLQGNLFYYGVDSYRFLLLYGIACFGIYEIAYSCVNNIYIYIYIYTYIHIHIYTHTYIYIV